MSKLRAHERRLPPPIMISPTMPANVWLTDGFWEMVAKIRKGEMASFPIKGMPAAMLPTIILSTILAEAIPAGNC